MLVTNRIRIVSFPFDPAKLETIADTLTKRAKDHLSKKIKLPVIQGEIYPYIENVSKLTFDELVLICKPDIEIKFRAFDNERVTLPTKKIREVKHVYDEIELAKNAADTANKLKEKDDVESEKKAAMNDFKERIESLDIAISENGSRYRQGYEMQSIEVETHLDFEHKIKVYTRVGNGEIVDQEQLDPTDYQMRMEFKKDHFEMSKENAEVTHEDGTFYHAGIAGIFEDIKQRGKITIKKSADTSLELPYLLILDGTTYGYKAEDHRDEDYTLARKEFTGKAAPVEPEKPKSKAPMKVVKDNDEKTDAGADIAIEPAIGEPGGPADTPADQKPKEYAVFNPDGLFDALTRTASPEQSAGKFNGDEKRTKLTKVYENQGWSIKEIEPDDKEMPAEK
jgi:hypothetical protein